MKRWTMLAVCLAAAVAAAPASARSPNVEAQPVAEPGGPALVPEVIWYDDVEGTTAHWTHADNTTATAHFHVDTYMAYAGHSWWCGGFAYDANGGYGNSWDDRLNLPPIDMSSLSYPVLSFAYRCHSEPSYDLTYVEAKQGGAFAQLNTGYDGSTSWTDLGQYGFDLGGCDNPLTARFRFVSDVAWSDEDGFYDSVGGAFMTDNVRVFDFYTSVTLFLDNVESGGLCTPSAPPAAGDYWHVVARACPAFSDPHCWWCGSDADTSLVPPNLANSLASPPVDLTSLSPGSTCTLRFYLHAEVPDHAGDSYTEEITTDGGATWLTVGVWWGDFAQCDGWGVHGLEGVDVPLPGTTFRFRLTFYTDGDGCGPGAAGGAGIMLDDVWLEATAHDGIDCSGSSWGSIKALFLR